MSARAKFYVQSVSATAGSPTTDRGSIVLKPVSRGAANAMWASATPSGEMTMFVDNPAGWQWFRDRIGKELYIDFSDVPESALDPAQHAYLPPPDEIQESSYSFGKCVECGQPEEAHQ